MEFYDSERMTDWMNEVNVSLKLLQWLKRTFVIKIGGWNLGEYKSNAFHKCLFIYLFKLDVVAAYNFFYEQNVSLIALII